MANNRVRTERSDASKRTDEVLDLLTGDWDDHVASPQSRKFDTTRGPWEVWSGPCSLDTFEKVLELTDGGEGEGEESTVPLGNMADVLILLARNEDGTPMFRQTSRDQLLKSVRPSLIVAAATFLSKQAEEDLNLEGEAAGKD